MLIRHDHLRQLRLLRSLTQDEVAAATGIDDRQLRKYESGQVSFNGRADTFQNLQRLAAFYGVPADDLITPSAGLPRAPAPLPPGHPYDEAGYVRRPREEREALSRLRAPRAPVVLQGPWLQGKGTLLGFLLSRPECAGARVLRVDLGTLEAAECKSLEALLDAIERRLSPPDGPRPARWTLAGPGSAPGRFTRGVLAPLLREERTLVLGLERADRLLDFPAVLSGFFALLRGWVDGDAGPLWDRLRLLVTVSAETSLLERADHSSFFSLANPIRLADLDEGQLRALAAAHGLNPGPAALRGLLDAVAGHPFLSRQVMNTAREREIGLDALLGEDLAADVLRHHLGQQRRWLDARPALREALLRLLADPAFELEPHDPLGRLCAQGLVVEHAPRRHRLRCAVYETYLRKTLCPPRP